jgi:YD repeat-containing protein
VSGDSRRVEEGQGSVYASTDSILVSSPFTLATGLQQLTVRHRRESGSGQSFYISLLRGPGFGEEVGPVAGVPVTTTLWQTATIDVGVYAGEVVRLKLRASANRVQFDDAGMGERLLPGWQTVNAGFGAITAGKDAAGAYLTAATAGGAFTLQSAPFSPGLSGGGGYGRYYAVAYDIGYGAGSVIRIWWVDQATQQSYVVFQDGADAPTGYRLRYAGLPASFGATGVFQVHVTGGGKLYSVGLNGVRQQQDEPYALEAGAGIDTVTGSFHVSQEDVRIDGAFPIPFVRTVHSHLDQPGVLGYGWSHLYAARLEFSQVGDVSVVLGAGREHFFRSQQGGTFAPEESRVQTLLARNPDNSYTYTTTTGLRYGFDAGGRLLTLTDAGGSVLTLGYTGGLLSTVSGAAGGLAFGYDAANRLATLSASTGVTISYQYNGDELAGVVRSDGHTTQYSYDARHHLTSRVENGTTVTSQSYDDVGRVVTQSVAGGQSLSIAYASPAQGVTAVTNAQGATTHYYHDRFGRTTQVLTPGGQLTTYLYDAAGNLLEVQHTGNQPPTVSLSAAPTSGNAPLAVSFAAAGSDPDGDTLAYSWDFGDGAAAGNGAEVSHLYAQGGVYTATVTVSDGLATASAQAGIAINWPPVVSLAATPTVGILATAGRLAMRPACSIAMNRAASTPRPSA